MHKRVGLVLVALAVLVGAGIALDKQFGLDANPQAVGRDGTNASEVAPTFERIDDGEDRVATDALAAGATEQLSVFGNTLTLPSYDELISSWEVYKGALFELEVDVVSVSQSEATGDYYVTARYSAADAESDGKILLCIARQMYVQEARGVMTTFCSYEGVQDGTPLFIVRSYACE